MKEILETIRDCVWGLPSVILILFTGLYLTFRTGFSQITLFPAAMRMFLKRLKGSDEKTNGVSAYQAFCTALAATVGTGNLAGVAGAISIGGPGAIFWMWVCAFLGMITKYAEAVLAVRFREKNKRGEWVAGPMYVLRRTWKQYGGILAAIYAFFGVVAALGVGNATQINTVISGINGVLGQTSLQPSVAGNLLMGVIFAGIVGAVLLGGAKKIGRITEGLVPVVSVVYIGMCILALILCRNRIPGAFASIISGAFSPRAATGGVIGSLFMTVRIGASRGVFTNEAGMGTAGIAHGSADVGHPVEQGLMGIIEVFLDTIVICTVTALVILCSGVEIRYGLDEGILLTGRAFTQIYGVWGNVILSFIVCALALATVFGWGLYGGRCAEYLLGEGVWKRFCAVQVLMVIVGAVLGTGTVWIFAEIVNGLMMLPNLLALLKLTPEVARLTKEYKLPPRKTGRQP